MMNTNNTRKNKILKIIEYTVGWILLLVSFVSMGFYIYYYYLSSLKSVQTEIDNSISEAVSQQINQIENFFTQKKEYVITTAARIEQMDIDVHSTEATNILQNAFLSDDIFNIYYSVDDTGMGLFNGNLTDVSGYSFYTNAVLNGTITLTVEENLSTQEDVLYFSYKITSLNNGGVIVFGIGVNTLRQVITLNSFQNSGQSAVINNLNEVIVPVDASFNAVFSKYISGYVAENEITQTDDYYFIKKSLNSVNWKVVLAVPTIEFSSADTTLKTQLIWFSCFALSFVLLFSILLHVMFYWLCKKNEERFREILGQLAKFRFEYNHKTDKLTFNESARMLLSVNSEYLNFSKNKLSVMGYTFEELDNMVNENKIISQGVENAKLLLEDKLNTKKGMTIKVDMSIIRMKKNYIVYGFIEDITAQKNEIKNYHKRELEQLIQKANIDQLTGLYNRNYFVETMMNKIHAGDIGVSAFLLIDLDNFKSINDTYGHNVGDDVLIRMAATLRYSLKEHDVIGRLGGDEFCVYLSGAKEIDNIKTKIKAIIQNISALYILNDSKEKLTCSIGVVIIEGTNDTFEHLYFEADKSLQISKKYGGNNYRLCTSVGVLEENEPDAESIINRADVGDYFKDVLFHYENNPNRVVKIMEKALENHEFSFQVQPIIDTKTKQLVNAEILARWNSIQYGEIYPNNFIEVFEKLNKIYDLDCAILEKSFATIKEWNKKHKNASYTINQSVHTLVAKGYVTQIKEWVKAYGINPKNITIDITEKSVITSFRQLVKTIEALKEMGFLIAIDDYGSGNSNIMLKKIKADVIKLDKSFMDFEEEAKDVTMSMVKSTISLAHELHFKVVAEGVEEEDLMNTLTNLGCDYLQGYYFEKPMDIKNFEEKYLKKE